MKRMDEHRARKYVTFFRIAYFFSASSLLLALVHIVRDKQKILEEEKNKKLLEIGQPVIRDESEELADMRKKGVDAGLLYKYSPEKGWHLVEYHRGEYLSKLQKKALEDANKVTEIKPDWSKGWGRKGTALHGEGDLGM